MSYRQAISGKSFIYGYNVIINLLLKLKLVE